MILKNPNEFRNFFSKFSDFPKSTIAIIKKDSIELRGFNEERTLFKSSSISFKHFFNESEIDIEQPIFVSFYEKIPKIISYLNNFKNECSFILHCNEITEKSFVALIQEWFPENKVDKVLTLDKIIFSDKILNLNLKIASLDMSKKSLEVTPFKIKGLDDPESTVTKLKFTLTKELKSKLTNLVKGVNNSTSVNKNELKIHLNENNECIFSMADYFDLKIEIPEDVKAENFNFLISAEFLESIDNENQEIKIIYDNGDYRLIGNSSESETMFMAASKITAKSKKNK
jgi:hypothetical protein